ncbi:tripartite tricarboxylate transporter permease [Halanaerobium sp. MA284_MarDTE_T2]|uniref:tripartite tricarboxylate transporter permease n=1 Tax=Halanaerobium sp. MA284_MarDTE_T2 TaxID=2183913 RepID=UPI000DF2A5A5|nr:tripartite tricarboxylate transporter permease [Halanaerobium sp. MA284_MarDTE_T2]RCW48645.1 putative tricarboxylic transport membrane protein [Halanaerobium sp. MA284_MarDTE_T2]
MINNLLMGFGTALSPVNLILIISSVVLGLVSGAVPGMSGVMTVVLLVPITYGIGPVKAFLILTAVYSAAVYAGSISAIMFRTPGAPEAVVTSLDGYKMTQKGRMNEAISTAVFASATGGIVGTIILTFLAPQLAKWALNFSEAEYFSLAIFGLTLVSSLGSKNLVKAFITMCIGLLLATVGLDPVKMMPRFTFGISEFLGGIDLVPIILGTFAISEMLRQIRKGAKLSEMNSEAQYSGTLLPPFHFFVKFKKILSINSLLGTFIGILPGAGATTASLFGYSFAQRFSKNGKDFGTGVPEGVAAPEVANNAASAGAMIPLLSLGIPGSATTAVMLGAFILHGMQPGPLLFQQQPKLVYTIFAGLFIVNVFILLLNKGFVRVFTQIFKVPYTVVISIIILLCTIGAYANRTNVFDIWVMLIFGIIAYFLEEQDYPLAPIILGLVLGGIAEPSMRRALSMSYGSFTIFFTRPISATLLILSLILFIWSMYSAFKDYQITKNIKSEG